MGVCVQPQGRTEGHYKGPWRKVDSFMSEVGLSRLFTILTIIPCYTKLQEHYRVNYLVHLIGLFVRKIPER